VKASTANESIESLIESSKHICFTSSFGFRTGKSVEKIRAIYGLNIESTEVLKKYGFEYESKASKNCNFLKLENSYIKYTLCSKVDTEIFKKYCDIKNVKYKSYVLVDN